MSVWRGLLFDGLLDCFVIEGLLNQSYWAVSQRYVVLNVEIIASPVKG